jgi:uroporphyrinogen decarboxylase
MNSRQRMLTALDSGMPDRMPASVHDWMQYYLDEYLGGITKAEAFEMFGLDRSIYEMPIKVDEAEPGAWHADKRIEGPDENGRMKEFTKIALPGRILTQTVERDKYRSPWITEYLCKEKDDVFELLRHSPAERYDIEAERRILDALGDKGIMRGCRVGPWHWLCDTYGMEAMIYAVFDDPAWVEDALDAVTERDIDMLRTMRGTKMDLLETGGGHNSSTVISPAIFEKFILPRERRIHAFARDELKLRTVYHTCGGMMPLLELLTEVGATAHETLTPPSMGGDVDLAEVKRRIGGKVCLIGGFDQFNGFERATPEETAEMVRRCFEAAGAGGGYILNPSDHFFDCPIENLHAYAAAARECIYR